MAKRTCDSCGKEKDIEGGKTCEKGHFTCKQCVWGKGGMFASEKKSCPLCKKPLK